MKWNFLQKQKNILLITFLLSMVPLLTLFFKIWLGEFAFWYDPARDLLSAVDNLSKPTLIGPTSGIPGVFYGPYWIWLLSLGTFFSLDPRVVTLIAITVPYIILFPFILWRFSSTLSPLVLSLLWLLFLLGFNNYFTDLWNPHLAPLLIIATIFLIFSLNHSVSIRNLLTTVVAGFTMGLVMNFHLSFGIGMFFGIIMYLIGENIYFFIKTKKKKSFILPTILLLSPFFLGIVFSFAPFLLFEIRHQFLQTTTLLNALFHYGGVVSLQGLSHTEILLKFLESMAKLVQIPILLAGIFLLVGLVHYLISYKKRKDQIKGNEIKLLSIVSSITLGVLFIYLTAKNPIWDYHFIGVEVLFLLLIGIIINKSSLLKKILTVWVVILVMISMYAFFSKVGKEHTVIAGTLIAKQKVVEQVLKEAGGTDYTVFAYNPAIYTYDYSYLFKWMDGKDVSYRPELVPTGKDVVFIIFPEKIAKSRKDDFINFRTPSQQYMTSDQWVMLDGTEILKRKKI